MQLAIDFAVAGLRADLGAERAASKADRLDPGWCDQAAEEIRAFARQAVADFTVEQARATCTPPPEGAALRAWGHVTRRATSLGYIERTGAYAPAASSNGSPKPLYRRGPRA